MDKPKLPQRNQQDKNTKNWLAYTGMAFEMFAVIGIFTTIGFFLDKKFDCTPILLLLFICLGFFISFYRILKQMR